jgi:carbon-monoxide dehydrogenase iron sulfur subunit
MGVKEVFINIERCTACKSCEIACAVEHSSSKDIYAAVFERPAPKKRVYVVKTFSFSYPARCMHCADAACVVACPTGAMHRDAETGSVIVNENRCMGCWMCAMVCPFGAITADPMKKVALKCDLCKSRLREGREPACVEACPTCAFTFGEPDELSKEKRMITAETVAMAVGRIKEEKSKVIPLELLRKMGGV